MANTCPDMNSCGTIDPIWSDEEPPEDIWTMSTMNAYINGWSGCKSETITIQVMRCSLESDHDLIYRYTGPYYSSDCQTGFCGTF